MDRIADYELVQSLGTANDGELFLAVPPARLGLSIEHVALKVLPRVTNDEAFLRATGELRSFAAVRSPYLAAVYDAGKEGSTFFYAMEWSPLGTLERPSQPPNGPEVDRAIASAARAAHALHEAGVLHRCITPASVLITPDSGKLTDLGLAEVIHPGQTGTSVGSGEVVEYLDPRVLLGDSASRSSDIWSLGATLHRARTRQGLYGALPIQTTDAIRTVLAGEPTLAPGLSRDELTIVQRCLAPADERFATADELALALDALDALDA